MIYRIFVEKKDNVQAKKEAADIKTLLGIQTQDLRLALRYDVEGLSGCGTQRWLCEWL